MIWCGCLCCQPLFTDTRITWTAPAEHWSPSCQGQGRPMAGSPPAGRDLAGLYVYQNYLRRLRRLHKNYVKTYRATTERQQQPRQQAEESKEKKPAKLRTSPQPFLPHCPPLHRLSRTADSTCFVSQTARDWPISRHAVKPGQSQEPMYKPGGNFNQSEAASYHTVFPRLSSRSRVKVQEGGKEEPIYVPCGREHSEIRMLKLRQKKQRERDRGGAWSFRTWKSMQELSSICYST